MEAPITYTPGFITEPAAAFTALWNDLAWQRKGSTPRREYYCNEVDTTYAYGPAGFGHEYAPQPWHAVILAIKAQCEGATGVKYEVCFLNGYENSKDQLGAHADNSPEMDDARPICIVTLGAEREIWFMPNSDMKAVTKLKLQDGSLCVMAPGMQDTHKHRIPKAGFECGPRISLTFRGFDAAGAVAATSRAADIAA